MAKTSCILPARGGGKPYPSLHRIAQHAGRNAAFSSIQSTVQDLQERRGNVEFVEAGRDGVCLDMSWLIMSSLKRKVSNTFLNSA